MMNIEDTWGAYHVASKRRVVHGCTMMGRGFIRASRFLPTTRRERALAAKLDHTRVSLAAMAEVVRTFSALEDARAHLAVKAARERCGGVTEGVAGDPALWSTVAMDMESAAARSKGTSELLDRVTEALERLAASLRDT